MRVGFNLSDLAVDRTVDLATRVEAVGLDSVWVGETWGWEAPALLGRIAGATEGIQLGTGILPVYSRSPALLGQTAATLDALAPGRFVLGLGASGPAVIENWHGADFDRPVGRTAETIKVVRQVLSGDVVAHDGTYFELDGFRFRDDLEDVSAPIYVGAMGPANVRMTGALADGWMPIFVPGSRLEELHAELVHAAEDRDRDPDDVAVVPNTVVAVSEDGAGARDAVRHHVAFYVGAMGEFYHRSLAAAGYEREADAIRTAWHEDGPEAAANRVTDEILDRTTVAGTPDHAAARVTEFAGLGVDQLVGFFPRRADGDLMRETIDHLGEIR